MRVTYHTACFGCAVGVSGRVGFRAAVDIKVDDTPALSLPGSCTHSEFGHEEGSLGIGIKHLSPDLLCHGSKCVAEWKGGGIVDQNIQTAIGFYGKVNDFLESATLDTSA